MTDFFIRFYSTYGHVAKLAEEIKKGAASVEGVEVKIWQVSLNSQHPCSIVVGNTATISGFL